MKQYLSSTAVDAVTHKWLCISDRDSTGLPGDKNEEGCLPDNLDDHWGVFYASSVGRPYRRGIGNSSMIV